MIPEFNHQKSTKLKQLGMEASANGLGADEWLRKAREIAVMLAAKNVEVTVNDVLKVFPRPEEVSPNATGSLFKDKRFRCVGRKQSDKVSAHAREVKIWSLS